MSKHVNSSSVIRSSKLQHKIHIYLWHILTDQDFQLNFEKKNTHKKKNSMLIHLVDFSPRIVIIGKLVLREINYIENTSYLSVSQVCAMW